MRKGSGMWLATGGLYHAPWQTHRSASGWLGRWGNEFGSSSGQMQLLRAFYLGTFFPARGCRNALSKRRTHMKLCFAVIATAALLGTALPAVADEVGVGVGPVGVTVGEGHGDRDVVREREVIRDRDDHRDRDAVIIKKGDHDRDVDHDRRKVIIDHD